MSRLYLDTNVVIRLVEDEPAQREGWPVRLAAVGLAATVVVTDLVRLECRVKPMASGDAALLDAYARYFASPHVTVVGLPTPVYDRATEIRARFRYGLADALPLAAAIEAGCEAFVTGDRALADFPDLRVVVVPMAAEESGPQLAPGTGSAQPAPRPALGGGGGEAVTSRG